jgi:hypothetical protein
MKALRILFVFSILAWGAAARTWADDDQAIEAFGQGVHSYFDGHYDIANKQLSEAIDANNADPRPYFFRGLVQEQMGQAKLASGDFQKGAEVEWSYVGQSFDVDDSLERIQGPIRIEIEKYRRDAAARAKELRQASDAAVDQDDQAKGLVQGAPLDPRNLPDVSQIVDATIPFPDVSAKPYFPPAKSADEVQSSPIEPRTVNAQSQTPPPQAADDPFNTGNQADKPDDSKEMKEGDTNQNPPPSGDDPFGGDKDNGAGDADSKKDGGQEPDPKPGEGEAPDSKDDPFGGG